MFCFVHIVGTFSSVFKDNKLLRSHNTVEINVFLNIFDCGWKDPGGPKTNLQIQITS
jgi:hypothetical protein